MKREWQIVLAVTLGLSLVSCAMDDADRCSEGLIWVKDQGGCIEPPDTATDTGSDSDDTMGDAGEISDSGDGDSDTGDTVDGLGDECWVDADCSDSDPYSVCLLDPTDSSVPGMCTFPGCVAENCPGEFKCCDCTQVAFPPWDTPYCVDSGSAGLLSGFCECQ